MGLRQFKKNLFQIIFIVTSLFHLSVAFGDTVASSPSIVVGSYNNGDTTLPLLLMRNKKESWSFVKDISGLPSDITHIHISSSSRTGNHYIITGWYFNKS